MEIHIYELPKGWQKSFGINLLKEIVDFYASIPKERQSCFKVYGIKEIYNELQIYYSCDEKDEINFNWIIRKYQLIARETCVHCGKTIEYGQISCESCEI